MKQKYLAADFSNPDDPRFFVTDDENEILETEFQQRYSAGERFAEGVRRAQDLEKAQQLRAEAEEIAAQDPRQPEDTYTNPVSGLIGETIRGVAYGAGDFVADVYDFGDDVVRSFQGKDPRVGETWVREGLESNLLIKPRGGYGRFLGETVSFMAPFLAGTSALSAAGKALQASSLAAKSTKALQFGKFLTDTGIKAEAIKGFGVGSVVDFVKEDPLEDNTADALFGKYLPWAKEYFGSQNDNDTNYWGQKVKNALVNNTLGIPFDLGLEYGGRFLMRSLPSFKNPFKKKQKYLEQTNIRGLLSPANEADYTESVQNLRSALYESIPESRERVRGLMQQIVEKRQATIKDWRTQEERLRTLTESLGFNRPFISDPWGTTRSAGQGVSGGLSNTAEVPLPISKAAKRYYGITPSPSVNSLIERSFVDASNAYEIMRAIKEGVEPELVSYDDATDVLFRFIDPSEGTPERPALNSTGELTQPRETKPERFGAIEQFDDGIIDAEYTDIETRSLPGTNPVETRRIEGRDDLLNPATPVDQQRLPGGEDPVDLPPDPRREVKLPEDPRASSSNPMRNGLEELLDIFTDDDKFAAWLAEGSDLDPEEFLRLQKKYGDSPTPEETPTDLPKLSPEPKKRGRISRIISEMEELDKRLTDPVYDELKVLELEIAEEEARLANLINGIETTNVRSEVRSNYTATSAKVFDIVDAEYDQIDWDSFYGRAIQKKAEMILEAGGDFAKPPLLQKQDTGFAVIGDKDVYHAYRRAAEFDESISELNAFILEDAGVVQRQAQLDQALQEYKALDAKRKRFLELTALRQDPKARVAYEKITEVTKKYEEAPDIEDTLDEIMALDEAAAKEVEVEQLELSDDELLTTYGYDATIFADEPEQRSVLINTLRENYNEAVTAQQVDASGNVPTNEEFKQIMEGVDELSQQADNLAEGLGVDLSEPVTSVELSNIPEQYAEWFKEGKAVSEVNADYSNWLRFASAKELNNELKRLKIPGRSKLTNQASRRSALEKAYYEAVSPLINQAQQKVNPAKSVKELHDAVLRDEIELSEALSQLDEMNEGGVLDSLIADLRAIGDAQMSMIGNQRRAIEERAAELGIDEQLFTTLRMVKNMARESREFWQNSFNARAWNQDFTEDAQRFINDYLDGKLTANEAMDEAIAAGTGDPQFFNVGKIRTDEDMMNLHNVVKTFDRENGQRVLKDVEFAKQSINLFNKWMKLTPTDQLKYFGNARTQFDAVKIGFGRKVIEHTANTMVTLGQQLQGLRPGSKRYTETQELLATHAANLVTYFEKTFKVQTNAAQTTRVGRFSTEDIDRLAQGFDPAEASVRQAKANAWKQKLDELRKDLDTPEGQVAFERFVKDLGNSNGDIEKILHAVTALKNGWESRLGRAANIAESIRVNGLLSGFGTQFANAASGALVSTTVPTTRLFGTGLNKVLGGKITGGTAESADLDFKEALSLFEGLVMYASDSLKIAKEAFKAGNSIFDPRSIRTNETGIKADLMNDDFGNMTFFARLFSMPERLMLSTDEFFKQLNYRTNVRSKALRRAWDLAEKGELRTDQIDTYVSRMVENALGVDPRTNLKALALDQNSKEYAEFVAFQNEINSDNSMMRNWAMGVANSIRTSQSPMGAVGRLFIPFVRTPLNVLAYTIRMSPLAPISKGWRNDLLGSNPQKRAQAIGELGMGVATMIAGYNLASKKLVTGAAPRDPEQREIFYAQGYQPYSVKVGDKWVSIAKFDPFASHLTMMADVANVINYGDDLNAGNAISVYLGTMMNTAKDKSFFTGLAEVVELVNSFSEIQEDTGSVGSAFSGSFNRGVARQARTFVPLNSLLRNARQLVDPERRATEAETLGQAFLSEFANNLPGFSDSLPADVNPITGQSKIYEPGILPVIAPYSTYEGDPVFDNLAKFSQGFSLPAPTIQGNSLNKLQYNEYKRIMGTKEIGGKTLYQALEKEFEKDMYKDVPEEILPLLSTASRNDVADRDPRILNLREIVKRYKDEARREMLRRYPELGEKPQDPLGQLQAATGGL